MGWEFRLQSDWCVWWQEAQNKLKAACSEPTNSPKGLQLLLPQKLAPEPADSQPSPEADAPEAAAAGTAGQALSADGQGGEDEQSAELQITQPVEATVLGSEAAAEPSSNEIGAIAVKAAEAELFPQQLTSDETATAGPADGAPGSGSSEQQGAAAASPGGLVCDEAPDTAAVHSFAHRSAPLPSSDTPAADTSAGTGPEGPASSESTANDEPPPSRVTVPKLSSASLSESPPQLGRSEQDRESDRQPENHAAAEQGPASAEEPGFRRPTVSSMLRQRPAAAPAKSRLSTDLVSVSALADCLLKAGHLQWLAVFLHHNNQTRFGSSGAEFSRAAHI